MGRFRSFAACAWLIACGGDARPAPAGAPAPAVARQAALESASSPASTAPAQPVGSAPTAPVAPAPPPAPATVTAKLAADSPCAALCTHSTELGCKEAASCEALCKESLAGDVCDAEQRAVTACMLAQPPTRWECDEMGIAALKDGFCEPEQGSFVTCVTSRSGGG